MSRRSSPSGSRPGRGRWAVVVLWVVAGGALLVVGVRLLGAAGVPDHWLTVPLLAVFPWSVGGTALAVGVGVVVHRTLATSLRAPVAVLVVTAVVGGVLVVPRAVARRQPSAEGAAVTIGVINVRRGLASADRIIRLVAAEDVDVLVVVELTTAFDAVLRAEGLTAELPHALTVPTATTAGGGIYARGALDPLRTPAPGGDTPDVAVDLPDGGGVLEVVSTHPVPPVGPTRTRLWREGLARIPAPPGDDPALVAGDLNATLDHATLRAVLGRGWRDAAREVGSVAATYDGVLDGSPGPPMAIDHVLVSDGIAVRAVATHDVAGSDHRMLVVDLRLPRSH